MSTRPVRSRGGDGGAALTVAAPAKINLYLEVRGRRADGYHEVVTVLQTIDLCDTLELSLRSWRGPSSPDVALRLAAETTARGRAGIAGGDAAVAGGEEDDSRSVPRGADNLAVRAAALVLEAAGAERDVGLDIALTKRVPAGGGLGGASSDAAAVLAGVNRLLGAPLPPARLAGLAARIGSDVAFFLVGGTALCTSRGEVVEPIDPPAPFSATLVLPPFGVSTARVYGALGAPPVAASATRAPPPSLSGCDVAALQRLYRNDLARAARAVEPRLGSLLDLPGLMLSGSGSSLFAFAADAARGAMRADASMRIVEVASRNR